jgi:hypothetical protein
MSHWPFYCYYTFDLNCTAVKRWFEKDVSVSSKNHCCMESEETLQCLQMTQYLSDIHVKDSIVGKND